MTPKLYVMDESPPVRAVYLTVAALGIDVEFIQLDILNGEHLKPEYLKLNPQHTVPTLINEDGTIIWDSHAINAHLVTKHGKDDSLYPKDPVKRAIVDQRLHFDSGLAFPATRNIGEPIIFWGRKSIPEDLRTKVVQVYEFLEKFLNGHEWVAGDNITIADFSLISTISTLNVIVPIDECTFFNIIAWLKRAEQLPYYGANKKGLDDFEAMFKGKLYS